MLSVGSDRPVVAVKTLGVVVVVDLHASKQLPALLEFQEGPLTGFKTQPSICRREFLA